MDYGFTTAAYVVASVLFILSLGGLSGQESAKRAVWYGIAVWLGGRSEVRAGTWPWWLSSVDRWTAGPWLGRRAARADDRNAALVGPALALGSCGGVHRFNTHIEMVRVAGMDEVQLARA